MVEGGATLLEYISYRAHFGWDLPEPRSSCPLANSISELEDLHDDDLPPGTIYRSACSYTLGGSLFLELYHSLGDEAFRRGFADLYRLRRAEDTWRKVYDFMIAAFVDGAATPEDAAIAEEIINRRYYGDSP